MIKKVFISCLLINFFLINIIASGQCFLSSYNRPTIIYEQVTRNNACFSSILSTNYNGLGLSMPCGHPTNVSEEEASVDYRFFFTYGDYDFMMRTNPIDRVYKFSFTSLGDSIPFFDLSFIYDTNLQQFVFSLYNNSMQLGSDMNLSIPLQTWIPITYSISTNSEILVFVNNVQLFNVSLLEAPSSCVWSHKWSCTSGNNFGLRFDDFYYSSQNYCNVDLVDLCISMQDVPYVFPSISYSYSNNCDSVNYIISDYISCVYEANHPPLTPCLPLFPTAFSPNGDGYNDGFRGVYTANPSECPAEMNEALSIYDRWGNLVFSGTGPTAAWDGRMNGGDSAPIGVYVYVYKARIGEEEQLLKGNLTLLR